MQAKKKKLLTMFFILFLFSFCSIDSNLVSKSYIQNYLNKDAPWSTSHGSEKDYLGAGMIYYSLVYAKRAKTCVCIGSGGAFVPRILRQAQRDAKIKGSTTLLIDGDTGNYGRPKYLSKKSFFKVNFPEVQFMLSLSHEASLKLKDKIKIDYLHIDADHSYEGCKQDFKDYLPLMNKNGIITIHDTRMDGPKRVVKELKQQGYQLIDFKEKERTSLGNGVAIIYLD